MKFLWVIIFLFIVDSAYSQFFFDTVEITGTRIINPTDLTNNLYENEPGKYIINNQNQWAVSLECPGLLLMPRGGSGAVSDICVNGGMFEQNLVMWEGMRLNDSQTGHFHFDIPQGFFLSDNIRTRLYSGNASSVYGSNAFGGVVDFSICQETNREHIRVGTGSDMSNSISADISRRFSNHFMTLILLGKQSDGYSSNLDYKNMSIIFKDKVSMHPRVTQNFYLYYSTKDFGAQNFYGPYPSYEETDGLFFGGQTKVAIKNNLLWNTKLYYKKHNDFFVLNRYDNSPERYENEHTSNSISGESYLANERWSAGFYYQISKLNSTNLKNRKRNNFAVFTEYSFEKGSLAGRGGLRYDIYNQHQIWAPSFGIAYYPLINIKLYFNTGISFREPSFTELYYHSPVNAGNENLKPETAYSFDWGMKYQFNKKYSFQQSCIYRYEKNSIVWVKKIINDKKYSAVNHGKDVYGSVSAISCHLSDNIHLQSSLGWYHYKDHKKNFISQKYYRQEYQWTQTFFYQIKTWLDYSVNSGIVKMNSQPSYWLISSFLNLYYNNFILSFSSNNSLNEEYEILSGLNAPGRQWFITLSWIR